MPSPSNRRKARRFYRNQSGNTGVFYFKGKTGKKECGLCHESLHGVPHGKRKAELSRISKTEKRPEVVFGGILCSHCRTMVIEETIKVKTGIKVFEDVSFDSQKFVKMAFKKTGE